MNFITSQNIINGALYEFFFGNSSCYILAMYTIN